MALETSVEPWLRGTYSDLHPAHAAVLHSFEQAIEDLQKWTADLTDEQIWMKPNGLAPVGFQLRHIPGSVDRLLTYALGNQLSAAQLTVMRSEMEPGASAADLLSALRTALKDAGEAVRGISVERLSEPRKVGRKELPTTVLGLLIHIAEHTQRHVGQAIVTAKLVRVG